MKEKNKRKEETVRTIKVKRNMGVWEGRKDIKVHRNRQKKKGKDGTTLVVLWLGLQVFTVQIQFLVGEQRSHKPQGVAKKAGGREKTGKEAETMDS